MDYLVWDCIPRRLSNNGLLMGCFRRSAWKLKGARGLRRNNAIGTLELSSFCGRYAVPSRGSSIRLPGWWMRWMEVGASSRSYTSMLFMTLSCLCVNIPMSIFHPLQPLYIFLPPFSNHAAKRKASAQGSRGAMKRHSQPSAPRPCGG
jgi:hypothetical protein